MGKAPPSRFGSIQVRARHLPLCRGPRDGQAGNRGVCTNEWVRKPLPELNKARAVSRFTGSLALLFRRDAAGARGWWWFMFGESIVVLASSGSAGAREGCTSPLPCAAASLESNCWTMKLRPLEGGNATAGSPQRNETGQVTSLVRTPSWLLQWRFVLGYSHGRG